MKASEKEADRLQRWVVADKVVRVFIQLHDVYIVHREAISTQFSPNRIMQIRLNVKRMEWQLSKTTQKNSDMKIWPFPFQHNEKLECRYQWDVGPWTFKTLWFTCVLRTSKNVFQINTYFGRGPHISNLNTRSSACRSQFSGINQTSQRNSLFPP